MAVVFFCSCRTYARCCFERGHMVLFRQVGAKSPTRLGRICSTPSFRQAFNDLRPKLEPYARDGEVKFDEAAFQKLLRQDLALKRRWLVI